MVLVDESPGRAEDRLYGPARALRAVWTPLVLQNRTAPSVAAFLEGAAPEPRM